MTTPSLEIVVAAVESGGVRDATYALRFERKSLEAWGCKMPVLRAIIDANQCSVETAGMIYWTSFGMFQIMGFNLYDPAGPVKWPNAAIAFAHDPECQVTAFRQFIATGGFNGETPWPFDDAVFPLKFARFYNGPGNVPDYAARLTAAANNLKGNVPDYAANNLKGKMP